MSFFSKLFKKRSAPRKDKPVGRAVPANGGGDKLTELRHQARTGDPKLNGKHRSGTF